MKKNTSDKDKPKKEPKPYTASGKIKGKPRNMYPVGAKVDSEKVKAPISYDPFGRKEVEVVVPVLSENRGKIVVTDGYTQVAERTGIPIAYETMIVDMYVKEGKSYGEITALLSNNHSIKTSPGTVSKIVQAHENIRSSIAQEEYRRQVAIKASSDLAVVDTVIATHFEIYKELTKDFKTDMNLAYIKEANSYGKVLKDIVQFRAELAGVKTKEQAGGSSLEKLWIKINATIKDDEAKQMKPGDTGTFTFIEETVSKKD